MTEIQLQTQERKIAGKDKTYKNAEKYRNAHTAAAKDLQADQQVLMQHHVTGKWDRRVKIVRKRKKGDSYVVISDNGKTYIRGRRLLKEINDNEIIQSKAPEPSTDPSPKMPRRSTRLQNKKKEEVEVITVRRTKTEYGGQQIKAKATPGRGSKPQSGRGQPEHHQHVNRVSHLGVARANSQHQ